MIIGSHNTMSYMNPKHWWMKPFVFMARCQDKSIQEQYEHGVRLFDLRFVFDKKGKIGFAHGLMSFKGDVDEVLNYLNSLPEQVYVRILNERDKNYDLFIDKCNQIQLKYQNIKFFGGHNKKDWKQLFVFNNAVNLPIIDKYSSCNYDTSIQTGWYLDDLYPRVYAFCLNKHWREKYEHQNIYLLQDFVGVY